MLASSEMAPSPSNLHISKLAAKLKKKSIAVEYHLFMILTGTNNVKTVYYDCQGLYVCL